MMSNREQLNWSYVFLALGIGALVIVVVSGLYLLEEMEQFEEWKLIITVISFSVISVMAILMILTMIKNIEELQKDNLGET